MAKFKVGIIGCGRIFSMHAQPVHARTDADIVAVCDRNLDRAKEKAEKYHCNYYTDYTEMFENEQLDVVHICLPHYLHAPVTIEAAKRGINILTEKPMSITYEDGKEMVHTAKKYHVSLGVIYQNRYNPGSTLIKSMLENGELGNILSGKLSVMWRRREDYYNSSDWSGTWDKEGGGVVINQAIHTFDLMRWFVNDEIEYVDAVISNRVSPFIEVEDAAEGVIRYKNGVLITFQAINYNSYDAPVEVELHCEKGIVKMVGDRATIKLDDGREFIADRNPHEVFEYETGAKGYWGVSHVKQIDNFYAALSAEKQPHITGEEALKTQRMIAAIYESGKKREKIYFT